MVGGSVAIGTPNNSDVGRQEQKLSIHTREANLDSNVGKLIFRCVETKWKLCLATGWAGFIRELATLVRPPTTDL